MDLNQASQPAEFFKGLFVLCSWTWQWLWLVLWGPPPGGPGDPRICCLPQDGSTGEPEKERARNPTEERRRSAGELEQKGSGSPRRPCHPATATPSAKGKGKGPERGVAWERCPAALPSWSWGRPQGRAGGWREGGRICGESCGLSQGLFVGRGVWSPATRVSPGGLAEKALLSLGNGGGGGPCL